MENFDFLIKTPENECFRVVFGCFRLVSDCFRTVLRGFTPFFSRRRHRDVVLVVAVVAIVFAVVGGIQGGRWRNFFPSVHSILGILWRHRSCVKTLSDSREREKNAG